MSWPTANQIGEEEARDMRGCGLFAFFIVCAFMTLYSFLALFADLKQHHRARPVSQGRMQFVLSKVDQEAESYSRYNRRFQQTKNYIVTAPYLFWIRAPFLWLLGTVGSGLALAFGVRLRNDGNGPLILAAVLFAAVAIPTFLLSHETEKRIWAGEYGMAPYETPDGFMIDGFKGDEPRPPL